MARFVCMERFYQPAKAFWHLYHQLPNRPELGVLCELRRPYTSSDVAHFLYQYYAGYVYPACYLPFVPDSGTGTPTTADTTSSYGGVRYYLISPGNSLIWNLPAGCVGMTRFTVFWMSTSSAGIMRCEIAFDGQNYIQQGNDVPQSGDTNYHRYTHFTVTGGSIGSQSKLRISNVDASQSIRVQCTVFWSDAAVCGANDPAFMPDPAEIATANTSLETALSATYAGSEAYKWFGGYYHNGAGGPTDGKITPISETVTRQSGSWTPPSPGYGNWNAVFLDLSKIEHAGSLYYDASHPELLTIAERYEPDQAGLTYTANYVVKEAGVKVAVLYYGAWLASGGTGNMFVLSTSGQLYIHEGVTGSNWATPSSSVKSFCMACGTGGVGIWIRHLGLTGLDYGRIYIVGNKPRYGSLSAQSLPLNHAIAVSYRQSYDYGITMPPLVKTGLSLAM